MIINEVCGRSNGKQATWNEYINRMIHLMAEQLSTDYHSTAWVINHYFQQAKSQIDNQVQLKPDYLKYYKIGDDKMKVMISQPMNGIPDSEVRRIQNELKERFAKYHIEVVDSFLTEEADTNLRNQGVFYLGRTIQKFLSDADAVYFVNGWEKARGCRIERAICEEYGIMILDDSFFKQENEVHIKRQFGMDKIQIMPCKSEDNIYGITVTNTANRQFDKINTDTYKHIPRIDGLEDQDERKM